jgi:hypothetical protein
LSILHSQEETSGYLGADEASIEDSGNASSFEECGSEQESLLKVGAKSGNTFGFLKYRSHFNGHAYKAESGWR